VCGDGAPRGCGHGFAGRRVGEFECGSHCKRDSGPPSEHCFAV
jgi:hypothetical protein